MKKEFYTGRSPIFDNAALTLYLREEFSLLIIKWKGFRRIDESREAHEIILEHINRFCHSRVLVDNRDIGPISPEMVEWVTKYFFPRLKESPVKVCASVEPKKVVAQYGLSKIIPATKELFQLYHTDTIEDAWEWLITQPV